VTPDWASFEESDCDARIEDACDVLTLCEIRRALDFPDPGSDLASLSAVTTSLTRGQSPSRSISDRHSET